MGKSSIGWLKHKQGVEDGEGEEGVTWGVVRGCSRISPGCGGGAPGREEGKHGGCYAERHGGRAWCISQQGEGCTFAISLPVYNNGYRPAPSQSFVDEGGSR